MKLTNQFDDDFFARMQMMVEMESEPIHQARKKLSELIDWIYQQDWHMEQLTGFANWRKLSPEVLVKARSFMVPDDLPPSYFPKEFHDDGLGFINGSRVIFSGRYCYPVLDSKRNVAGFVGYDAFETPKYLDSFNYGYKSKTTMYYGMENIEKIYRDMSCAFVEGPVCKLRGDEADLNILSSLGSKLSPYMVTIMRRFGRGALVLPDSDEAGDKYAKQIKYDCPQARVMRFTKANDLDDTVKEYGPAVLEEIRDALKHPFGRYTYIK